MTIYPTRPPIPAYFPSRKWAAYALCHCGRLSVDRRVGLCSHHEHALRNWCARWLPKAPPFGTGRSIR